MIVYSSARIAIMMSTIPQVFYTDTANYLYNLLLTGITSFFSLKIILLNILKYKVNNCHNNHCVLTESNFLLIVGICVGYFYLLLLSFYQAVSKNKLTRVKENSEIERYREVTEENTQLFDWIFESSSTGQAIVNLEGRWIKVNKALCNILGRTEKELLNTTFQEITPKEDLERDLNLINQLLNKEVLSYELEKRYIKKDGLTVEVLVNAFLLWGREKNENTKTPKFFVIQVQDISERKKLEANTTQVIKELERTSVAKDDFLSTVSHELRTPLTNMKMAIKMIKLGLPSDCLGSCKKYMVILENECSREIDLINNLLDLQRLESGYVNDMIPEEIYLASWIEDIIASFETRASQNGISIHTDINTLSLIVIDLVTFSRIMCELLNNACKYTEIGGDICISVNDKIEDSREYIEIAVRNKAEVKDIDVDKLFNKFYRVPFRKGKSHSGGTGLGLALIKKLIENMEGSIIVKNEIDKGYIAFILQLPLRPRCKLVL